MGPRAESPLTDPQSYRFPASPVSSTSTATPSRYALDSPQGRDASSSSRPAARRAASSKAQAGPRWPNAFHDSDSEGSITETRHGRLSPQLHRKSTTRRKSDRALTLPSTRQAAGDLVHSRSSPIPGPPLSRRSSSASSSSSGNSPKWTAHPPASAGIGRKVAASLDLFKETASTPTTEEPDPFDISKPVPLTTRHRNNSSRQLDDVEAPEFEFVKRSDWPDREAAAVRREKSTTALERVRTRDRKDSVSGSHGTQKEVDGRKRKDRQPSVRDSVRNDLSQWRHSIAAHQDDGRGRPRERLLWPEDKAGEVCVGSPESVASASSSSTLQDKYERHASSFSHRHPSSSVHRPSTPSPADELSPILPSSVFVRAPEHEIPPPATFRTERPRSPSPPLHPSPEVPSFAFSSFLPQPSTLSPWSSDDEDDDESAWETASVTTTTSTTSASSPFPLSPSRTSLAAQPLVRHPSDEDEEHTHRGLLSPFHQAEWEHEDRALQADTEAHDIATDWGLNFSQESLPHIPLRPFKNQVGGHSAIYKFTKRAVCKVSIEGM